MWWLNPAHHSEHKFITDIIGGAKWYEKRIVTVNGNWGF
jgi:hypothetical protein